MEVIKRIAKSTVKSLASRYGIHRRQLHQPMLWVLMYHRVLPTNDPRYTIEEPGMVVTPETLDMHLREVKKYFTPMRMKDWIEKKQSGEAVPAKACVITFDDGWLDNLEFALPLLEQHQLPATLFAVAEKIGTPFQFWPNIILWLLFNGGSEELKSDPLLGEKLPKNTNSLSRDQAAAYIVDLKQFSDQEIFFALDAINQKISFIDKMPRALMNWDELKLIQRSGLVDIGSHTCSHKRLNQNLDRETLQHEILDSKDILENHLNCKINLFCFPNGDYNQTALNLVQTHYDAAVTTRRGIVSNNNFSIHELRRIGLHEEVSRTPRDFGARLSGMI